MGIASDLYPQERRERILEEIADTVVEAEDMLLKLEAQLQAFLRAREIDPDDKDELEKAVEALDDDA